MAVLAKPRGIGAHFFFSTKASLESSEGQSSRKSLPLRDRGVLPLGASPVQLCISKRGDSSLLEEVGQETISGGFGSESMDSWSTASQTAGKGFLQLIASSEPWDTELYLPKSLQVSSAAHSGFSPQQSPSQVFGNDGEAQLWGFLNDDENDEESVTLTVERSLEIRPLSTSGIDEQWVVGKDTTLSTKGSPVDTSSSFQQLGVLDFEHDIKFAGVKGAEPSLREEKSAISARLADDGVTEDEADSILIFVVKPNSATFGRSFENVEGKLLVGNYKYSVTGDNKPFLFVLLQSDTMKEVQALLRQSKQSDLSDEDAVGWSVARQIVENHSRLSRGCSNATILQDEIAFPLSLRTMSCEMVIGIGLFSNEEVGVDGKVAVGFDTADVSNSPAPQLAPIREKPASSKVSQRDGADEVAVFEVDQAQAASKRPLPPSSDAWEDDTRSAKRKGSLGDRSAKEQFEEFEEFRLPLHPPSMFSNGQGTSHEVIQQPHHGLHVGHYMGAPTMPGRMPMQDFSFMGGQQTMFSSSGQGIPQAMLSPHEHMVRGLSAEWSPGPVYENSAPGSGALIASTRPNIGQRTIGRPSGISATTQRVGRPAVNVQGSSLATSPAAASQGPFGQVPTHQVLMDALNSLPKGEGTPADIYKYCMERFPHLANAGKGESWKKCVRSSLQHRKDLFEPVPNADYDRAKAEMEKSAASGRRVPSLFLQRVKYKTKQE
mmetsp:Transcript_16703/g.41928  ORF Transcript_16703/g.41928 Transcript_16703/m.41928 type:complete len:717 (-) Transcript_16703:319-2469(-)